MRTYFWPVLLAGALAMVAAGEDVEKSVAPAPVQDIEVTVRHASGAVEVFGKEVASMDIIVDNTGRIQMVHLVLVGGAEKDTHVWYNYANLTALKYRFLHITGKGKVQIKQIQNHKLAPSDSALKPSVKTIEVDDYK